MLHSCRTQDGPRELCGTFVWYLYQCMTVYDMEEDVVASDTVAAFRSKLVADCAAGGKMF